MPIFGNRRKPSFRQMDSVLPSPNDPLAFLQAGRSAGSGGGKDAFYQILGSFHVSVADVDRAIKAIIDRLRHEKNISDIMAVQANNDVRAEMARAGDLTAVKRNELQAEISYRLETMFLQNLIMFPEQEPPVRRWISMADLAIPKDTPVVSEPALSRLDGSPKDRRRRLRRWQNETDQWLEVLCLNRSREVINKLVDDIGDYSSSWGDIVNQLRRESLGGGRLALEVSETENWNLDDDDPTVKNLVSGVQAQETANRILGSFHLRETDLSDICHAVHDGLNGKPLFGSERVDALQLEGLLTEAIAEKIKDTVAIDNEFLSLASSGSGRAGEGLVELLADMRMGAAAMEEKLWRVGDYRMGHVDSASGVGITSASTHDSVRRSLGGGRKFATVEGHPSDKHRFEVQMSTVGASLSDLSIFQDMVNAWYTWHFEERRGEIGGRNDRSDAVRKDYWKLYPDIGQNSGVHSAVIELIDDDLRQVWNTPGDVALRLAYGQLEEADPEVVQGYDSAQPKLPG